MDCLIPFFTSLGLFLMVYFSVFCAVFYCKGHDPTISPGKPFSSLIEFAIRNIFPLFCSHFPFLISFIYFYLMVMIWQSHCIIFPDTFPNTWSLTPHSFLTHSDSMMMKIWSPRAVLQGTAHISLVHCHPVGSKSSAFVFKPLITLPYLFWPRYLTYICPLFLTGDVTPVPCLTAHLLPAGCIKHHHCSE